MLKLLLVGCGNIARQAHVPVFTPHSASSTAQCDERVGKLALATIRDWIAGNPIDLLSPAKLKNMT